MKYIIGAIFSLVVAVSAHATGRLVDVTVTDVNSGRDLTVYTHKGRYYIPGVPGRRYSVDLENRTGERLLVVLSVDGVNVITGETASPEQSGYVLEPWAHTEIQGWRKSLSESAEFYFTELPDSYAARTSRPGNVGVIGVAVFRERPRPIVHRDIAISKAAPPAAEAGAAAPAASMENEAAAPKSMGVAPEKRTRQELGTGHGERRYDPVNTTQFRRLSSRADEILSLYYDDYQNLVNRGIIPRKYRRQRQPEAFPGGFVPDPQR